MAISIITNVAVVVNSVTLTDHVKSVTLSYEAEMQDTTHMGQTTRVSLAGLKNWSVTLEMEQDYAGGSVDATLFALVGAAAFTISLTPTGGSPAYSGNVVLESYNPLAGSIGELAMVSASFKCAGVLGRA